MRWGGVLPISYSSCGALMVIQDGVKNIKAMETFTGADRPVQRQGVSNDRREVKTGEDSRKDGEGPKRVKETHSNTPQYKDVGVRLDVEDSLHMVVAKIIDKDSGEVVRQIPPDDRIKIAKAMKEIEEKRDSSMLIDTEA